MPVNAVVGYDGSPSAGAAIDAGAALFPAAHGWITYLWMPPYASEKVRGRLRLIAHDVNELIEMVDQEGEREAQRLVAMGVTLAGAAGWDAEPMVKRTWGAEGLRIAQAAEQENADVILVGSRGLGGTAAVLGSVSDMVVHYSARPVVVVPYPMLADECAALSGGPLVVGWDGSAGAEKALAAATRLFSDRDILLVSVAEGSETQPPSEPPGKVNRNIVWLSVNRAHGLHARAVSDALIAVADDRDAALLVVGSRGHSAAREILLGTVAMGTLHHAHRPVMIVPGEWDASSAD